jgi:hypothetical protein
VDKRSRPIDHVGQVKFHTDSGIKGIGRNFPWGKDLFKLPVSMIAQSG